MGETKNDENNTIQNNLKVNSTLKRFFFADLDGEYMVMT